MGTRSVLLHVTMGLALAGEATAQTILHTYSESEIGAEAGTSVAIWDDVNHDGYRDWVVGVPGGDVMGQNTGRVRVFSGFDNTVLANIEGTVIGSSFGQCTANVGDLNSDGFDELAVGATGESKIYIYSGATSGLLWSAQGPPSSRIGWAIAAAGDVNGDGVQDVVAGAQANGLNEATRVFSGDTGALVLEVAGVSTAVAGIGDVNSDGFDDLLVGYGVPFVTGGAKVLAGPLGSLLYNVPGNTFGTFGYSVATLEDLNGDGINEFAVGDPTEWYLAGARGRCTVHSGVDGAQIWLKESPSTDQFGAAVANAGDVDNDGFDDLIIGEGATHRVFVYSVVRDVELLQLYVIPINHFGTSVAAGHDIDGDGYLDFIGGGADTIYGQWPHDPTGAVLFTHGCWPDAVYNYCDAVANSTGQRARMMWQNTTSVGLNNFRLFAIQCPPNKPGLFFYGSSTTNLPVGDGHLCVTGGLNRLAVVNTGATGEPSMTLDFTNPPNPSGQISAGETWYFSFWFRDPQGGPGGFNFADGLRATFCP